MRRVVSAKLNFFVPPRGTSLPKKSVMSAAMKGYFALAITMCIWGGFTLLSRVSVAWMISPWDITALRFGFAFLILMPIFLWKKDTAFLWTWQAFALAMIGGLGYCITSYTAFHFAPAAHAAIFLNGFIPVCTAVAAYFILKQGFDRHTWISLAIMFMALTVMSFLMLQEQGSAFGIGDVLFFVSAMCWGAYTALLKRWYMSPWHSMSSVAIWSAIVYLPIYLLFIPKQLDQISTSHLVIQTVFHGVLVVIVATLSYIAAIRHLGAFKAGSLATLAPFIAAVLAVPLLNEPLSMAMMIGLIGMGIGALQPWRWLIK